MGERVRAMVPLKLTHLQLALSLILIDFAICHFV